MKKERHIRLASHSDASVLVRLNWEFNEVLMQLDEAEH